MACNLLEQLGITAVIDEIKVIVTTMFGTEAGQVAEGNHTHDGRYYTETETDTKLDEKADTSIFQYAGLSGAHAYNEPFTNDWHEFKTSDSSSFEVVGSGADSYTAIRIIKAGLYRISTAQRGTGGSTNAWCSSAIDGDRSALNATGIYSMGESRTINMLATHSGVFQLPAGTEITAGAAASDSDLVYGDSGYHGSLIIERIR